MIRKNVIFSAFLFYSTFVFADTVDEYLESQLKEQKIPGISLAIVKDGTIVKAQGYGFSNIEHQVAAKPETIYQSGSVGKQFTATAVMMLVEDGKIGLDDPITKYFKDAPKFWKQITVRHLLTHTSGIPDYTSESVNYRSDYTEDDLLKILMKLKPEFSPGEKWNYSNSGYMLLGFLIRKVTGKFYGDVLEERVFGPLGMTTAQVISESDIIPNRAAGYQLDKEKLRNQDWVSPTLNTTADGALYLTVLDMARWDEGHYGTKLLKQESFKKMWTPVRLNNQTSYPYGFGWRLGYQRGHRVIEHSGHWQGFSTGISRYPDYDLTVIILTNLSGIDATLIAEEVAGIHEPALQSVRQLKPIADSNPALSAKLKEMLSAVAEKKDPEILMPTFRAMIDDDERKEVSEIAKDLKTFEPLVCDQVHGERMEFYGGTAVQFCNYRIQSSTETRFLTAGISADGKITEFTLIK
jgi:CubicO group peptidase (beta-lactamase class C family)